MRRVMIAEHRQVPMVQKVVLLHEVSRVAEKGQVVSPQTKCLLKDGVYRRVAACPVETVGIEKGKPAGHRVTRRQNETTVLCCPVQDSWAAPPEVPARC